MNKYISNSDLRRLMVMHKVGQTEMLPEYIPPEGLPGIHGPDPYTELMGFRRDYDQYIERILQQFPQGGMTHDIAAVAAQFGNKQQSHSAGSYLRATLREFMAIIAPEYKEPETTAITGPTPPAQLPLADLIVQALRQKYSDADSVEVLDSLDRKLINMPNAQGSVVIALLAEMTERFGHHGDDYMAETASMLKAAALRLSDNVVPTDIPQAVKPKP